MRDNGKLMMSENGGGGRLIISELSGGVGIEIELPVDEIAGLILVSKF